MKWGPQSVRLGLRAKPAPPNLSTCALRAPIDSPSSAPRAPSIMQYAAPISPFRMNTCKSVSKQSTLTPFRMNTYAKPGGEGVPPKPPFPNEFPVRKIAIEDLWKSAYRLPMLAVDSPSF